MTSRRDWQLQQLGITQWALRRPTALQGEIAIAIPAHVRLVMVAEERPALNDALIGDVLRSLKLTADQVLQLTPDRVAMLPPDSHCNCWRMGETNDISLSGSQISSPVLEELKANPKARSALWQQICEYEHDFFPHDA